MNRSEILQLAAEVFGTPEVQEQSDEFCEFFHRATAIGAANCSAELEALRKAAAFGIAMLDAFRDQYSDLDGGQVQETAVKFGLLEEVPVGEGCGENCACIGNGVEADDVCYRRTPAAINAAKEVKNG